MHPEQSPLPRRQLWILCSVVFAEAVSLVVLYPFVYFMVRDFHISTDEKEIGKYVGLLAASFSLAQFLTSIPWGFASDRIGRRPVILIGLLGTFVTSIAFGMSKTYIAALVSRILCGLLNGNLAVAKCMLGELTDKTNQSEAFAWFGFSFGAGVLVAPVLGGLLADPASKYPWFKGFGGLFINNPYLLPCFITSLVTLFGFVFGCVYLEETLVTRQTSTDPERQPFLTRNDSIRSSRDSNSQIMPWNESKSDLSVLDDKLLPDRQLSANGKTNEQTATPTISRKRVTLTILSYGVVSFSQIFFQEVYVLWCNAKTEYGGLGWGTSETGISIAFGGLALLLSQLYMYPFAERCMGNQTLLARSLLALAPVYFFTGFIRHLISNEYALWAAILLHQLLRTMFTSFTFSSVMVLVNETTTSETLGIINGIAQAFASLVRTIGPALGGIMWSSSLRWGQQFPMDFNFSFVFLAIFMIFGWAETFFIK